MAKPTGFMDYPRKGVPYRPVEERINDYNEVTLELDRDELTRQAARCMDCGLPFCHSLGCPLGNLIPDFNDLVYREKWQQACDLLHSTNNFPEFTGRICPAPCEASCTLNMELDSVLIHHIEYQIVEKGWQEGWIKPLIPAQKTGKRVAVIGSGPAGLAAAQQLARAGHDIVVFEKDDEIGGLLRYGIPDFKLAKTIIDRRLEQMHAEGVEFQTNVIVGRDISVKYLRQQFDAIVLTMGAGKPRDLTVVGRGLQNIHFAMDYLKQQNMINAGKAIEHTDSINAKGKVVVVIGGGDTGSDCVGTARRQGAKEIHQFEILPKPPENSNPQTPWPDYPRILRTSSSHEEGCNRRWCVMTRKFSGTASRVSKLHGVEVQWTEGKKGWKMKEVEGSEFEMKVDLVLLAMGFMHVEPSGIVDSMDLSIDKSGNVTVDENFMTSQPGIFAAGDTVSGASLVVRAIDSGRKAAEKVDQWLETINK